ncbi:MAG: DNA-directed DNA polymerase, partial [Candidatus Aenigmatarchaeota archaeon]
KTEEVKKRILAYSADKNGEEISARGAEIVEMTELNRKVTAIKVICRLPRDVPLLKDGIRALDGVLHKREYDIPFAKRYALDRRIKFLSPYEFENGNFRELKGDEYHPKVAAFDIEIYKPTFRSKENEIICIGLYSEDEQIVFTWKPSHFKKARTVKDEAEMLERFLDLAQNYDVLVSYNGDNFDLPFIKERAAHLKIDCPVVLSMRGAKIKDCLHVDLYNIVAKHIRAEIKTRSRRLDDVAKFFFDEGKADFEIADIGKDVWDSNDLKKIGRLLEYNLQDCRITYLLSEKILPLEYRFSNLLGLDLFDVTRIGFSQLVESYLMRQAVAEGILIPNKPNDRQIEERRRHTYIGGYVHKPVPGIYENISVMDFKSLYPTILVSHNISPDTLDPEGEFSVRIKHTEHRFKKKPEGFIVGIVRHLIKRRAELKKSGVKGVDEKALKTLANATYGYLGFFGARWYSRECAESITALGRGYIQNSILEAENFGLKVLYSDTDSVMVTGEKKVVDKFLKKINSELTGIMELEFEGFYPRGVFVGEAGRGTKKRYALKDEKGNVEIKGFEFVRGDWSEIAKETQMKVIEYVLSGDGKKALEFVKDTCREIRKGEIPKEKLVISRQLTKPPEQYGTAAPHVKVARDLQNKGVKVNGGCLIKYVITREGKLISDRAKWWEDAKTYDADYYVDHQVIPPAFRILSVLGYTKEDLKGCQSSLESF